MGEEICAWIKLKNPEDKEKLKTDDIRQFCKDKVTLWSVDEKLSSFFYPLPIRFLISKFLDTFWWLMIFLERLRVRHKNS